MKTRANSRNNRRRLEQGYALTMVMVLSVASVVTLAGMLKWTMTSSVLNDRNNTYVRSVAAAEAASEVTLGYMSRDFLNQTYDPARLDCYSELIPTNDWAAGYRFTDGGGGVEPVPYVSSSTTLVTTNLESQFQGLYGLVYSCSVRGNATPINAPYAMTAAVEQEFQLASIPVFQFAIFYAMDLEINPGAPMVVTGKVHSNANLYTAPPASLEFADDVGAVGQIYLTRAPDDPTGGSITPPIFDKQHVNNVSSLTLPISTNNSPSAVQQILDVPPFGEDPRSDVGQERYFNKCDLIVTTEADKVQVQAGNWDSFSTVAGNTNYTSGYPFVRTNVTFYDGREAKSTQTTEIDVAALKNWIASSSGGLSLDGLAQYKNGHHLNSVYVLDKRSTPGKLSSVRLVNGRYLPPDGLTVATPLPLYVEGHYNAPNKDAR